MQPVIPPSILWVPRTISGRNAAKSLLREAAASGARGIVAHGRSLERNGRLAAIMQECPQAASVQTWEHTAGEPTLDHVAELILLAREFRADWIAAVGGGSVMDVAKAAAGLVNGHLTMEEYHAGTPPERPGIPFIAVPTTAGTGSEVTPNAVLTNPRTNVKKSIRSDAYMARLVILDPTLLAGSPARVIAHAGMDALTQAIETFTSRNACWLSDALALQAARMVAQALPAVHADPAAPDAEPLLVGSYLGGVALAMARLGVVHGIVHPLGALYHQPHGLLCAVCLPLALELNRPVIGAKYDQLSGALGGDAIAASAALLRSMGIASPLAGQPIHERERIVAETLASGSTAANPKKIDAADVNWMLDRLFASR